MTKGDRVALAIGGAAVVYVLFTVFPTDERSSITLYSQSGAPIGKWIGKGRVKITDSGCSFTSEDGKELSIGGPYVVERQR